MKNIYNIKDINNTEKYLDEMNYEVQLLNICKNYSGKPVFHNFNFSFVENKITVILGPSGCGKTTLLNIISGLEKPDKGKVILKHEDVSYIFQEDTLIPWLTVYENMAFVLKSNLNKCDMDKIIDKYLSLVKLKEYKDRLPKTLSGGMKRRVAIARALAYDSKILIMDEPFKGLHEELKKEIMDGILKEQKKNKKTIILVTHIIEEAEYFGDYIYKI